MPEAMVDCTCLSARSRPFHRTDGPGEWMSAGRLDIRPIIRAKSKIATGRVDGCLVSASSPYPKDAFHQGSQEQRESRNCLQECARPCASRERSACPARLLHDFSQIQQWLTQIRLTQPYFSRYQVKYRRRRGKCFFQVAPASSEVPSKQKHKARCCRTREPPLHQRFCRMICFLYWHSSLGTSSCRDKNKI